MHVVKPYIWIQYPNKTPRKLIDKWLLARRDVMPIGWDSYTTSSKSSLRQYIISKHVETDSFGDSQVISYQKGFGVAGGTLSQRSAFRIMG